MTHCAPITSRVPRAFTLIELLVVITIIAILIGLVAGAGVAVLGNRNERLTENILTTLDRALSDYMTSNGDVPPPYVAGAYANTPGTGYFPGSETPNDASNNDAWTNFQGDDYPRHPDASVFLRAAQGFGAVDSILEGLGDNWLVATPESGEVVEEGPNQGDIIIAVNEADPTPSVLDAWADPNAWSDPWPILGTTTIYYVHPDNLLAQSLYGRCSGGRPYFFSAGPDRRYGTSTQFTPDGTVDAATFGGAAEAALDDNLYSSETRSADLTPDFRNNTR